MLYVQVWWISGGWSCYVAKTGIPTPWVEVNGNGRSWHHAQCGRAVRADCEAYMSKLNLCRQVPRLPRQQPRRQRHQLGTKRAKSQPSAISATPAAQSARPCLKVQRLPCKVKIDVAKCRGPAAATHAAAPPEGSVYCACHTKASRGPAAARRAAAPPEASVYCACHTKASRSSSRRLCVLRLPLESLFRLALCGKGMRWVRWVCRGYEMSEVSDECCVMSWVCCGYEMSEMSVLCDEWCQMSAVWWVVVCVCVVWEAKDEAEAGGGGRAEGAAGAERKARTPHSDVGKKRNAQHPCTPAQWFWWLSRWPLPWLVHEGVHSGPLDVGWCCSCGKCWRWLYTRSDSRPFGCFLKWSTPKSSILIRCSTKNHPLPFGDSMLNSPAATCSH